MRVLIMDDHQLVSGVLSECLKEVSHVQVETAKSHHEALALISKTGPFECFLADLRMPGVPSVLALKPLIAANSPFPVYLFSGAASPLDLLSASQVGAAGMIGKCTPLAKTASLIGKILANPESPPAETRFDSFLNASSNLTKEDYEVLGALSNGASNDEIAKRFGLTGTIVSRKLNKIYRTLGVNSRLAAASAFVKEPA